MTSSTWRLPANPADFWSAWNEQEPRLTQVRSQFLQGTITQDDWLGAESHVIEWALRTVPAKDKNIIIEAISHRQKLVEWGRKYNKDWANPATSSQQTVQSVPTDPDIMETGSPAAAAAAPAPAASSSRSSSAPASASAKAGIDEFEYTFDD